MERKETVMPNKYQEMKPATRKKWNSYANQYNKRKYKIVAVRFDKEKDAEVIQELESRGQPAVVLKDIAKEALAKK